MRATLASPGNPRDKRALGDPSPGALSWAVMAAPVSEIVVTAGAVLQADTSDRLAASRRSRGPVGASGKRIMDILIATLALVLVSPLMIAMALLIRLTTGSPVIYAHQRVGAQGRLFRCFKFRTMVNNGAEVLERHLASDPVSAREWSTARKLSKDPRVTRLGALLRRSSIDELPQLFNVLRGDMSCVGPRPIVVEELRPYGENAQDYLAARPGMTGIWQVCGRNSLSYDSRVKLDAMYVRHWSMLLDLAILIKTIPAVLKFNETA
jgi:exopolysaccharide production protein ExoY